MTIGEIIREIKLRRDIGEDISDSEILGYINDVEGLIERNLLPEYENSKAEYVGVLGSGFSLFQWSEDISIHEEDILGVFIEGKKIYHIPENTMAYFLGYSIREDLRYIIIPNALLGDIPADDSVTFLYKPQITSYELGSIDTDTPRADQAYHDLYVYYTLAQVATKAADSVAYSNYITNYNGLYLEYYNHIYKNKMKSPGVVTNAAD